MANFKKLGLDRLNQNIANAINQPTGTVVTGDITRGSIVEHTTSSNTVEEIKIRARSTGCFPITIWFVNSGSGDVNWKHDPENNRILVKTSTSTGCLFRFWVW